jgi:hypothetical protein
MAPLGYDTKGRKISINDAEAERVRTIFRSYLQLGSLNPLMADLRQRGIVTKVRTLKTGETTGGIPFTRGSLAHLLRNRFYIGEVAFKGEVLKGEQPVIVDKDLFHARPMRSETRARLVAAIARGRRWLDELIADPSANADSIAKRENCSTRKINMTISLAFLAPDLVQAAIGGRLPHGMGVARLTDLPAEWSRQHQILGLPAR